MLFISVAIVTGQLITPKQTKTTQILIADTSELLSLIQKRHERRVVSNKNIFIQIIQSFIEFFLEFLRADFFVIKIT